MSKSIAKRHNQIMNKLHEEGFVNVSDLSEELDVSMVTIRKDLKILESRNLLFRTHGSATLVDPYIIDRNIHDKEKVKVDQKSSIAKLAASYVFPNDSIILGSGSTVLELARQVKFVKPLSVITASLNVAQLLNINQEMEVHQLGGLIRKSSNSAIGPFTENMMTGFSCNKLFLGVDGIDPEYGLTTTNALEASLNKVMIKSAQKLIVLADSSKFGRRGFGKICDLFQVDLIITDFGVSDAITKKIESQGVEVVRA